MAKNLTFNTDVLKKLSKGVESVAKPVGATMGPCGKLVMFNKYGQATATKDGVSVAKEIELEDPVENLGAQLTIEVSSKTNDESGDNTSTASVLTYAMVKEGLKAIDSGIKPIDLKNGMNKAARHIVKNLEAIAKPISTSKEIIDVATISANNDPEIGTLIGDIVSKVGKDGVVIVKESNGVENVVDKVDGFQFNQGWISPDFSTNKERMEVEYENAKILITDTKLVTFSELLPVLEKVAPTGTPLLIICEDCEERTDAWNNIMLNTLRGVLKICVVKSPSYGEVKKSYLHDIATITGANVISTENGMSLLAVTEEDLGTADIKVTRDSTTITNGKGDKEKIAALITEVKGKIAAEENDHDKKKLESRLARLSGGVAIVYVGGLTDTERKEKKYRVDDTVAATKAALEEGIVPGGGIALVKSYKEEDTKDLSEGELRGYNIVIKSLSAPLKQIVENAGCSGDVVLDNILKSDVFDFGYDARNGKYCNMYENGIIDTAKGIKKALVNATSVSTIILNTECAITDIPKKEEPMTAIPTPYGMMPA